MARHRDEAFPDDASSGPSPTPVANPADPALRRGADFAAAPPVGHRSDPNGSLTPQRSPMAFGYPEFEPAGTGEFEFRAASWQLGSEGFEQIGDAEVIRRGLRSSASAPAWDPLADPWPAPASVDPGATQPVLEFACEERVDQLTVQSAPPAADATPAWGPAFAQSGLATQPVDLSALFGPEPGWTTDHPSGPLPQGGTWPPGSDYPTSPGSWLTRPSREPFDATLAGASRPVELGMRGGRWFSLRSGSERPITVTEAIRSHPALAGQITQLVCWWMRQQPMSDRAVDLAYELSCAMAEMARHAAEVS
jgi:hypothetical protein